MKNRNQNPNHSNSNESLALCIEEFLQANSYGWRFPTYQTYAYMLVQFAQRCGDVPIANVTTDQLLQFVQDRGIRLCVKKQRLVALKSFLRWCRSQGCIFEELPRAVAGIRIEVSRFKPEIVTPVQLKSLLSGTTDVELLLFIALSAFTGLRVGELQRLQWHDIKPGTAIPIAAEMTKFHRVVQMHPTLDAWLRPFYGTDGPVVPSRMIRTRFHNLGKQLNLAIPRNGFRHSYFSYYLALVGDVNQVATQA